MTPWYGRYGQQHWGSQSWTHGGGKWNSQPPKLADASAWWTCPAAKCVQTCRSKFDRGPWCNPTSALVCQACAVPRPAQSKPNPPKSGAGSTLSQLQAALGVPKKTYAQAAAAAPNALLTGKVATSTVEVPAVKEDGAFDMATDAEEESHTTPLAIPDEFVAVALKLVHPLPLVDTDWCAATELDRVLPKKGGGDAAKLESEAEGLRTLLSLQYRNIADGEPSATTKKLEAVEKKIEKLANSSTAAPLARCELEVVAKRLAKTEEERANRTAIGSTKSTENADRLEEICREQMEGWQQHLITVQAERSTRTAAWLARELLLEGRALELRQLADEKIAAATDNAGSSDGSSAADSAVIQSKLDVAIKELAQQKKDAASERNSLLERLDALEKKANAAPAAQTNAPARLQDNVYTQCSLAVVYTVDELPVLKSAPDKEQRFRLALIQSNLAHWAQAGMIPATFGQLMQGAKPEESQEMLATMKYLTGEQVWERFFKGVDVETTQYVPFQLGTIMNTAISKAEAVFKKFSKEWDFADKAKEHFATLLSDDAQAKREGTGRYCRQPGPY